MSTRNRGRGGRNRGPQPRPVQISKKISWLLRHGADSEGLHLDEQGFIGLDAVLANRNLRSLKVSFEEIQDIVKENDKQRFTLLPIDAKPDSTVGTAGGDLDGQLTTPSQNPKDYKIRANQGHSLKLESDGLLQPLSAETCPSTCVHGTTHAAWTRILASGGLKPMGRNHIHFASGLPAGFASIDGSNGPETVAAPVISGMRNSSTVLVYMDVGRAMEAGIKFWLSDNGVILSEGNAEGVLPVEFFQRVEDRKGEGVLVQDGKVVKETPKEWSGKEKGNG